MSRKKDAAVSKAAAKGKDPANAKVSIGNTLKMLLELIWKLDKAYYPVLVSCPCPMQPIQ